MALVVVVMAALMELAAPRLITVIQTMEDLVLWEAMRGQG